LVQLSGNTTFPCSVIRTTTFLILKGLVKLFSFPQIMFVGFVLLILVVAFVFIEFTSILLMVVRSINLFLTLHAMVNL
jgi:hypothetical protein